MTPPRTCTRCLDRPAADGLGWCRGCRHRIDRDLGDLPALAVDLADTMARVSGARTGDHRRSADTPLPYAERAAEALHGMRAYLVAWCRLLYEEVAAPLPADTITAMAVHLMRWLAELDRHPASGEFAGELREVYASAAVAIDLPRDRTRVFVGPCPTTCEDGRPCPGEVWAHFPVGEEVRPECRCRVCESTWPPESWASLGRRLGKPGSGWVTPGEAAALAGRSFKTVYNAAAECRWRRLNTEGGVLYLVENVTAWRDTPAC